MEMLSIRGCSIPLLGLGTWKLAGKQCVDVVQVAISLGYRHFDTARMYGNESDIGSAIAASELDRGDLFVTTKLWTDELQEQQVADSVEDSLRKLKSDYIDLMLIHWPNRSVPLTETLEALHSQKEKGRIRMIGVSNFPANLLTKASALADICCNQVEYHPFIDQSAVLEVARSRGMFLTAYCPLARGAIAAERTLQEIGAEHGKTALQVGLRWLVQQESVVAIPKASSRDHLQLNLDVFDFQLTDEQMARISSTGACYQKSNPGFSARG